jgi:hypothetical protein
VAVAIALLLATTTAWYNKGGTHTTISSTRFEVTTGSVVLGAKQLLVDTSNGDVWILEGNVPDAHWVLLARGPEDVRDPPEKDEPDQPQTGDSASE